MYDVSVTIWNKENGRSETKTENGLDEDEVRAQLKEWGQHLESGDDWFLLYDEDDDEEDGEEDEEYCLNCDELVEDCECEDGPST